MIDFSQLLTEKTDTIVERWVKAVSFDRQIESTNNLPRIAVQDHIPQVLTAMATVLSQSQDSNIDLLVRASLEHGVLRAEQGFDPSEIAREYRLLRQEIFSTLAVHLQSAGGPEVLRAVFVINSVVDEAIAQCFRSYVDERLRELQQLQTQMMLTNQELTRLVRTNQDNLSQLAHELKTPLNSIIGYSELFLRSSRQQDTEIRDSSIKIEHIQRVLRNGRQLLRLVNDTLELSRSEVGKMQLHLVPIDVRVVINTAVEVLEPLAAAKQLRMAIDCDRAPNQVLTDPLRLQQIVMNLLSNAIRYTESGTIQLTCESISDDQWSIAISDTGVGIPAEDHLLVFEPFYRVNATSLHSPDSTGLGLAIVSQLVKLLQGKIELVSQVGIGSTFTVILPMFVKTSD